MFSNVSLFSIFVPVAVAMPIFPRLTHPLKVLAILMVIAAFFELCNFYLYSHLKANQWVVNIYTILEMVGLVYICIVWKNEKWYKITALVLLGVFALSWIYYAFTSGIFSAFFTENLTQKSLSLTFLFGYLLIGLSVDDHIPVYHNYKFWISAALLIYFSISVVLWATRNLEIDKTTMGTYTWYIHSYTNIFVNLLVAYGFICYYRKMKLYI